MNDDNMALAKELVSAAKELMAATQFDKVNQMKKTLSKPTDRNVRRLTKMLSSSEQPKTAGYSMEKLAEDLASIANELLENDGEE